MLMQWQAGKSSPGIPAVIPNDEIIGWDPTEVKIRL